MRKLTVVIQAGSVKHATRLYEMLALAAEDTGAWIISGTLHPDERHVPRQTKHATPLLFSDGKHVTVKQEEPPPPVDTLLGMRHTADCYEQMDETGKCVCP